MQPQNTEWFCGHSLLCQLYRVASISIGRGQFWPSIRCQSNANSLEFQSGGGEFEMIKSLHCWASSQVERIFDLQTTNCVAPFHTLKIDVFLVRVFRAFNHIILFSVFLTVHGRTCVVVGSLKWALQIDKRRWSIEWNKNKRAQTRNEENKFPPKTLPESNNVVVIAINFESEFHRRRRRRRRRPRQ